jgi:hypothetical protein
VVPRNPSPPASLSREVVAARAVWEGVTLMNGPTSQ